MVRSFHFRMGEGIDEFHRLPAVGSPNIHAFDWIALIHQFSGLDNERVPLVEVLGFGWNPPLRFTVAHGSWADFGFIKMTLLPVHHLRTC